MAEPLIPAYPHPQFQPAMRIITAITNGFPAVVTTSFAHNYLTGLVVRLDIPDDYGMVQANQQFGPITVLSDTTFSIPIDTTFFDAFVVPSSAVISTLAQAVPMAEVSSQLYQAVRDVAPYIY
ncbi:MAG: hypothetical protein ABSB40_12435 [Nitrososphaeria archaeon]|jgi:hypothetical protein